MFQCLVVKWTVTCPLTCIFSRWVAGLGFVIHCLPGHTIIHFKDKSGRSHSQFANNYEYNLTFFSNERNNAWILFLDQELLNVKSTDEYSSPDQTAHRFFLALWKGRDIIKTRKFSPQFQIAGGKGIWRSTSNSTNYLPKNAQIQ